MSDIDEDKSQIERVIWEYIDKLQQSKVDAVLSLFTEDAVLMAADIPTMEGAGKLKAFFDQTLGAIRLDAKLEIDEIAIRGTSAFVRSHAHVKVTVLETGESHPEHTRELFLLVKNNEEWKIERYMFNRVSSSL